MSADYKQPDKRGKSFAKNYRPAILLVITLILGSGGIYLLLKGKKSAGLSGKEPQRCMYWSNDRYLPVSCDKKIGDTLLIAYDSIKMATFKKIIQFDTIREGSLGRVWYIKINGRVEYFTSGGFHPIYTRKRLLPLTPDMMVDYDVH